MAHAPDTPLPPPTSRDTKSLSNNNYTSVSCVWSSYGGLKGEEIDSRFQWQTKPCYMLHCPVVRMAPKRWKTLTIPIKHCWIVWTSTQTTTKSSKPNQPNPIAQLQNHITPQHTMQHKQQHCRRRQRPQPLCLSVESIRLAMIITRRRMARSDWQQVNQIVKVHPNFNITHNFGILVLPAQSIVDRLLCWG